jgi:transcriptional regulator with XRE-family HTH domain
LRNEHFKLTLKAFAQRLKTGAGYIHELETGKKGHPSDEFIGRISGEFSVRKRWLMEGIGPPFLHVPKFYEFDKLAPSDVAFANQLAPHYSALSTKLLTSAIQELANLLPGLFEDEMDIFLENILAITGELMRRAKVRRGTEEARSKPKALPMVETIESACEGERALMLEDELAQAKKEIEDRGFVAVEPNLLQRRVEAGVPVGSLRVLLNRDEKGTPLDPPTVKELSENQRTVLELWAEYWEAKNRGEERPEPPPFSLDANALREDLKAYFHDPYQALHLRRERALAGARMVAKVEEPANIRRKPEARRPAPPMPAPGAHTLPPKAS